MAIPFATHVQLAMVSNALTGLFYRRNCLSTAGATSVACHTGFDIGEDLDSAPDRLLQSIKPVCILNCLHSGNVLDNTGFLQPHVDEQKQVVHLLLPSLRRHAEKVASVSALASSAALKLMSQSLLVANIAYYSDFAA